MGISSVDLETLISLAVPGGDGKVACVTTLPSDAPDMPAESFRLPLDQRLDWIDRNGAPVYDREDSTKGSSNPKSHNLNPSGPLGSTSQRFSGNLKHKKPIIGLPRKLRVEHSGFIGHSARYAGRLRIFPRKKAAVPGSEPASPKVSCFGKVLSERECPGSKPNGGFFARLVRIFVGCGGRREPDEGVGEEVRRSVRRRPVEEVATPPAPALGAMRRFASGRSWASLDLGGEDEDVDRSGPLDGGIQGRRGSGPLEGLECERELRDVGPASV